MEGTFQFLTDTLFCGTVSGIGNCISGYMFDTIKVRMQLNASLTMTTTFKNIIQEAGYINLFSGMYYPLLSIPAQNAVIFGSYEIYKKIRGKTQLSFIQGIQNGAFSGLINSFLACPVELIKCQMQVQSGHIYKSSSECAKSIFNKQGIKGLYKGYYSTLLRDIAAFSAQFAAYQEIKSILIKSEKRNLTFTQGLLAGGLAGINCWIFSFPFDIIKTKLQVEPKGTYIHNKLLLDGGFYNCASKILKKQGIKGFWSGIQPCLIRAFIANAFGFAIYQKCKQLVGSGDSF